MSHTIEFGVKAETEAEFWQSWIDAGIASGLYEFLPGYPGIQISSQSQQGWTPTDSDGVPVPGWHANVRVTGPLVDEMTYGLDQFDENGILKSVFYRTWATNIFSLVWHEKDPISNFPAGYRNQAGTVAYCDLRDIEKLTNVWA